MYEKKATYVFSLNLRGGKNMSAPEKVIEINN